MTHASLFSGIGGFDLAARNVGWSNVFHCEQDEFCQKVLAHHFPESICYGDIKQFDATDFRGRISVLSGGFPCQPFSAAGKRAGTSDDRHLWPEMLRVISEIMPRWVVGENVRGLLSWGNGEPGSEGMVLDEIVTDLEGLGYEVFPTILPACSVEAPHRRDRLFIIAYSNHQGGSEKPGDVSKQNGEVSQRHADTESCNPSASDAANANDQECQRRSSASQCERQEAEQRGNGVLGSVTRLSQESYATYSDSDGFQGRVPTNEHRQQSGTQESIEECVPYGSDGRIRFEEFPTQSPICGGDDGLPTELDGVTFSKWRRESIKCYGNAVVVPLIEMIFRTIIDAEQNG